MYLCKNSYVKNWSFMTEKERHRVAVEQGGTHRADIKPERITSIVEEVAYWRKANAIHRWFVAHVQDGVDDGKHYPVSRGDLDELLRTCKEVLAHSTLVPGQVTNGYTYENGAEKPIVENGRVIADATTAKRLLPTQAGFFFGSTDYDEYYFDDVADTVRQLEAVLAEPDEAVIDFEYRASW
ncbi:hypothetical protein [Hyphomicrobium denitrificans]|nr:hypothetical protein [Hyphomicrobium denitrificans]